MLPADPGVQHDQDPLQREPVIERLTTRIHGGRGSLAHGTGWLRRHVERPRPVAALVVSRTPPRDREIHRVAGARSRSTTRSRRLRLLLVAGAFALAGFLYAKPLQAYLHTSRQLEQRRAEVRSL